MSFFLPDILARIKTIKQIETDKELASALGVERTNLIQGKKRGSSRLLERILGFAEKEGLSFDWLFKGQGAPHEVASEDKELAHLLSLTQEILTSDDETARIALSHNIKAFHEKLIERREKKTIQNPGISGIKEAT